MPTNIQAQICGKQRGLGGTRLIRRILCVVCMVWTAIVAVASGQIVPLHFGTTNGVVDEFGFTLRGTDIGAPWFGFTYVTGEVVQILDVNNGVFPPNADGTPSTNNPVLFQTRIGAGVDPGLGPVGMFGGSMYRRPSGQIIARVFNRPSLAESSFYTDSEIFVVPTTNYGVFIPVVARTDHPLDSTDDDADGLLNSWEKSLGSNPNMSDTDGDGVWDGSEFRAGTEATNPESYLHVVQLAPAGNGAIEVVWDSVAGKRYVVEFSADGLRADAAYTTVTAPITATGDVSSAIIPGGLLSRVGHYRVCLAE